MKDNKCACTASCPPSSCVPKGRRVKPEGSNVGTEVPLEICTLIDEQILDICINHWWLALVTYQEFPSRWIPDVEASSTAPASSDTSRTHFTNLQVEVGSELHADYKLQSIAYHSAWRPIDLATVSATFKCVFLRVVDAASGERSSCRMRWRWGRFEVAWQYHHSSHM